MCMERELCLGGCEGRVPDDGQVISSLHIMLIAIVGRVELNNLNILFLFLK